MKSNLLTILFATTILGIITYGLITNAILTLSILFISIILFFLLVYLNNFNKKENLNIIRDEDKLYFYLTDDLLFSIKLNPNKSINETLKEIIYNEINSLNNIVKRVYFINFKEDELLKEINNYITPKQS